jgi:hypothetical protein
MKRTALYFIPLLLGIAHSGFSQGFVSAEPDSVKVPCPACPGSDWSSGQPPAALLNYPFNVASSIGGGNTFSKELQFYDYDLFIPATSTVSGVEVDVIRMANGGSTLRDSVVKLMVQGQPMGQNGALQGNWLFQTDTVTYGAPYNTWGINLTPAMVNGNQLGISFTLASTNATLVYYQVRMRVYYDLPMGVSGVEESSAMLIYPNPSENKINLDLPHHFTAGQYEIIDARGLRVGFIPLLPGKNSLNVSDLNAGMYLLNLGTLGAKHFVLK